MTSVGPAGYIRFGLRSNSDEVERLEAATAVLQAAEARLDGSVAEALGPLSISSFRHQDDLAHWLQIRSQPLPAFAGAEFRFDIPAGKVPGAGALAGQLAESASRFVGSRDAVVGAAEEAKAIAIAATGRLSGAFSDAELVAVGVSPNACAITPPGVVVELRTLGHGLRPVVERIQAHSLAALPAKLDALSERHSRRARLRAALQANGAIGWIDETTRRMLSAAGKDAAYAIERLDESGTMQFWMIGEPGSVHGTIYWREGVLKVDFGQRDMLLKGDTLNAFWLISAKVIAARIGRPFGKLIKSDFIPGEAIVVDAERDHADTYLTLAMPTTLLPAKPPRRPSS